MDMEKFEKNNKSGLTLISLVITVIILALLTGVIINSSFQDDGLVEESQGIIEEQKRKVMIEKIAREIQTEQLKNEINGQYVFNISEHIIPILESYGTYDNETLLLTTEEDVKIYLFEMMEIPMIEYASITYEYGTLTIVSELINNGYIIEYTTDAGVTWNEYTVPIQINNANRLYTRIKNDEGKVISNVVKVREGTIQSDDITPPVIRIATETRSGKTIDVTIFISEYGSLSKDNVYQYYLSTSKTIQENGEWKEYVPGNKFTIGEGINGIYYIHVKGVSDTSGNTSDMKVSDELVIGSADSLGSLITPLNYGDEINYSVNGISDWKIFYSNENGNVFLITSDYLPINKVPISTEMTTTGTYSACWETVPTVQTVSGTARRTFLSNNWNDFSTNENGKCVSTLLNTDNWTSFVNSTYADYAIGSPTIEMWTASWNAKLYTPLYCDNKNTNGYYIGTSSGTSLNTSSQNITSTWVKTSGYDDELFFPYQSNISSCKGYWLASPASDNNNAVMNVYFEGIINHLDSYNSEDYAIRPVVCLDANVKAIWNGNYWELQ